MKRYRSLRTLFRDHHRALVVASVLCAADEATSAEAREGFLRFWEEDGEPHLRAEEAVLLPRFAAAGGAWNQAVARVLLEHAEIRLRALRVFQAASSPATLRDLGELLGEHIRLEEQVLFPAVEEALDDGELESLAADLHAAGRNPGRPRS